MTSQTGDIAELLIRKHFRRRKWSKSGGNDVMLLDELSQGWSKKLLPRLAKKEKWWLHKLQKENAGTTKWTNTTTNTNTTTITTNQRKDSILHYQSRFYIRM